ncbi:hypothetical protein DFH06DRAFT_1122659 [Mycena polygramma]|nr:hypothetical protein DFH06DRAFT_1122659 [Mycena polygramma]
MPASQACSALSRNPPEPNLDPNSKLKSNEISLYSGEPAVTFEFSPRVDRQLPTSAAIDDIAMESQVFFNCIAVIRRVTYLARAGFLSFLTGVDSEGGDVKSSDLSDVPDEAASSEMDRFVVPDTVGNEPMSDDQPPQEHLAGVEDTLTTSGADPVQVSAEDADDQATNASSTAVKRKRRISKRTTAPVNDSDEEDLTAMAKDDSTFSKGFGVKPSMLPPLATTRSATAKPPPEPPSDGTLSSDSTDAPPHPSKKKRVDSPKKERKVSPVVVIPEAKEKRKKWRDLLNPGAGDMDNSLQAFMREQQLAITQAVLDSVLPVLQSAIAAASKTEEPEPALTQPVAQEYTSSVVVEGKVKRRP